MCVDGRARYRRRDLSLAMTIVDLALILIGLLVVSVVLRWIGRAILWAAKR